jgi:putative SOS response-associated peptidase YedK
VCNLYNITTSLEALRALVRAFRDVARWNEPSIDIYPNTLCPVIRVAAKPLSQPLGQASWVDRHFRLSLPAFPCSAVSDREQ